MADDPRAMIESAERRMDDRLVRDAVRAALRWQYTLAGMGDSELVGLDAALDKELERRGLIDRAPRRRR